MDHGLRSIISLIIVFLHFLDHRYWVLPYVIHRGEPWSPQFSDLIQRCVGARLSDRPLIHSIRPVLRSKHKII